MSDERAKRLGKYDIIPPCHRLRPCETPAMPLGAPYSSACGAVAEWSKALAWKVSIRQKRIQGSNPCRSAIWVFYPVPT